MAHTFHELKEKTIQELRDIAKDVQHEAVQGFSQMNKEHLLPALCKALGIDVHEHHTVSGIDMAAIKAQMRELKQEKQEKQAALEARNHVRLHQLRRQVHALNRQIRAHVSG
jgi:DNA-binding IclR family transcriptional regulator